MAARHGLVPSIVFLAFLVASAGSVAAGDWPMWRHDAGHSAAAPESLPDTLRLKWTRQYAARVPVWDDPLNQDMMPYDRIFEPVVQGQRMFLGFNDSDKLVALDTRSGRVVWTFYSDGPIRFSPVAADGKVYFCSDDGWLYCLDAGSGKLRWKLRGGPGDRKVLGNRRLISAWPARGGPVLRDQTVYFAASIWPFMGTFLYAVDAQSGKVRWLNDSTGADYIKQPHAAPAFAGVAPQGQLVATEELLLVPGGRSCPAAFERATGRLVYFEFGKKGEGGSFVAADESRWFVHTRVRGTAAFRLSDGRDAKLRVNEPVLTDGMMYAPNTPGKAGDSVASPGQADDEQRKPAAPAEDASQLAAPTIQAFDAQGKLRWQIEADGSGDLIKAGNRLYAAGAHAIVAIDVPTEVGMPTETAKARIAWSIPVSGKVMRLLAADGMLFAVTLDGQILAFSAQGSSPTHLADKPISTELTAADAEQADKILQHSGKEGYALWFGVDDGKLLEAVVARSALQVVAVDPDPDKVRALRARFDAAGLYGNRVAVHAGDPAGFQSPPYIAHLVVVGRSLAGQMGDQKVAQQICESVRPYGGKLCVLSSKDEHRAISATVAGTMVKACIAIMGENVLVTRQGPLPGAADWTHAYGDIANTAKSNDRRVKAPLGLLWFGGNSNLDVLPRHGHGPSEQVIDGRLFIEGINSLSARDVYTGRVLWTRRFRDLGSFNVYYDSSYAETPLSTAYNQKHLPGANLRGTNFVATHEGVYLVVGSTCLLLDAATGATLRQFKLPAEDGQTEPPAWGFVGVYENRLLAGVGFADYTRRLGYGEKTGKDSKSAKSRGPAWEPDKSASLALLAFDRRSGRVLWKVDAIHSFLHNGIVAGGGRIYCLDRLPKRVEEFNKRRGATHPKSYRVVALDAATGKERWSQEQSIFGTWLSYSQPRDMLLLAGAAATDRSPDEANTGMATYRGRDGSLVWQDRQLVYAGPCMIHHDTIITNVTSYKKSAGAFSLLDGKPATVANPLTGELEPWSFTRSYGCNTAVACENLLTFRSGAAGYYDLVSHGGTGNLGGFKSGCSSNLIAANGVLNAPDYTRTCTCAYQNQTSLALIHMPEVEMWTYTAIGGTDQRAADIRRIGINLGAPGDRRAHDGTLWLEHPTVGGMSPKVAVEVAGAPRWFRRHSARASGEGLAWVAASGVEGAERVVVHLRPTDAKNADRRSPRLYTVRLYFLEPDDRVQPGQRVFDVTIQGKPVLPRFDIVSEAGAPWRSVVRTFPRQPVADDLIVAQRSLTPRAAILCGIEAIAE